MTISRSFVATLNIILLLTSCSTTSLNKVEFPASANNINKFKNLDPEDPTYIVYASKLIDDLRQQSVAALRTKNSGRALKASSIGVNLFPFRNDLVDLKRRSAKQFLSTTKKMAQSDGYRCNEIKERVSFLKSFAPDQIVDFRVKNCSLKATPSFKIDDLLSMVKIQENQFHKADIKYSKGIEGDLNQILKQNQKLPLMDVLVQSLSYLSSFSMNLRNFEIDPDTRDDENIILYSNDVDSHLPSKGTYYADGPTLAAAILTAGIGFVLFIGGNDEPNEYCEQLCNTLEIKKTSHTARCRFSGGARGKSCSTSQRILNHKGAIFSESWLPRFVVMKVTGKTNSEDIENYFIINTGNIGRSRDGVSSAKSLFDYFKPSDNTMFGKDDKSTRRYWKRHKRDLFYHNVDDGMPFLGPVSKCRLGEYCLYGMKREVVKNLQEVSVRVDVKSTLHLMGNYWNEYLKVIRSNTNGRLSKIQKTKLGVSMTKIFKDLEKTLKRTAR